jgi:hypothetical protein
MKTFSLLTVAVIFFFSSLHAKAELTARALAGLGFTNNANFEEVDKDSDFYYLLRGSGTYIANPLTYAASLSYRGFMDETQQNVFNYHFQTFIPITIASDPEWDLDVGIGGQNYTKEAPGTTEESFDNVFLETGLTKAMEVEGADLSLEPRYELKSFPGFAGRIDHTLSFGALVDWAMRTGQTLEPFVELGFVRSNQELYTRTYFELGTDWGHFYRSDLKGELSFMTRFSTYPNRTVSDQTVVANKRGRIISGNQDSKESQTFTQIGYSVAKIKGSSEFKAGINASSQDSKSGTADYSELGFLVSAQIVF